MHKTKSEPSHMRHSADEFTCRRSKVDARFIADWLLQAEKAQHSIDALKQMDLWSEMFDRLEIACEINLMHEAVKLLSGPFCEGQVGIAMDSYEAEIAAIFVHSGFLSSSGRMTIPVDVGPDVMRSALRALFNTQDRSSMLHPRAILCGRCAAAGKAKAKKRLEKLMGPALAMQ
jgi:hypothetical protein